MNALEVVQEIVERHGLQGETFTLVSHRTTPGWRQQHRTARQRLEHLGDGLRAASPSGRTVAGRHLLRVRLRDLDRYRLQHDHVVSISSLLTGPGGTRRGHSLLWGCNLLRLNGGHGYQLTVPTTALERRKPHGGPIAAQAAQLAEDRHRCQLRKSGEPTVNHLREVADMAVAIWAEYVAHGGPAPVDVSDEELYDCGYLHDCIEDTDSDYEDVVRVAGARVAD